MSVVDHVYDSCAGFFFILGQEMFLLPGVHGQLRKKTLKGQGRINENP